MNCRIAELQDCRKEGRRKEHVKSFLQSCNSVIPQLIAMSMVLHSVACADSSPVAPRAHLVEAAQLAMGSEVRMTAWTADEPAARSAFAAAFGEFDRLDALMSVWRAGSDVQRLNAAAWGPRVGSANGPAASST
jgi:thiamine biosynthesis lipoprotein ApbE